MEIQTLRDNKEPFDVSVHKATDGSNVVLFAVGSGGLPERYTTLLTGFVKSGCTVIAPHFERLASAMPTEQELVLRARRLSLSLDAFGQPGMSVVGVGHSIGATTLLALSGAHLWLRSGHRINMTPDARLIRLAMLAPPTGFFQGPGALNSVRLPIRIYVGSEDNITPPAQSEWLANALQDTNPVDLRIIDGAGHFSFMDSTPPNTTEPLADKASFLLNWSDDVSKFVTG